MTFDPKSVEVTCVTLPKDHCVKSHGNTWMYVDTVINFAKLPHTPYYIYYIHTTCMYRTSDHIVAYWTQFRQDKNGITRAFIRRLMISILEINTGRKHKFRWNIILDGKKKVGFANFCQVYPGGTHILWYTGMCRSNGCFFTRNPLAWVPFSTKVSLNMGPFPKFSKTLLDL